MSDPKSSKMIPPQELGYLEMPSNLNLGDDFFDRPTGETFADKAMRKSKENPFVPLGKLLCLITDVFLASATA